MSEEIKEYTLKFHKYYERLAPNYGYETRKDTKEFDFNSNNGKLMYATVSEIISPLLQKVEQLEKENETLNSVLETLKETNSLLINQKYKLEYELDTLDNKYEQLENIRKEAIEYIKDWQSFPHTNCTTHNELKNLLNILNKGDNNGRK